MHNKDEEINNAGTHEEDESLSKLEGDIAELQSKEAATHSQKQFTAPGWPGNSHWMDGTPQTITLKKLAGDFICTHTLIDPRIYVFIYNINDRGIGPSYGGVWGMKFFSFEGPTAVRSVWVGEPWYFPRYHATTPEKDRSFPSLRWQMQPSAEAYEWQKKLFKLLPGVGRIFREASGRHVFQRRPGEVEPQIPWGPNMFSRAVCFFSFDLER